MKKFISVALAVIMILSVMSVCAFAADLGIYEEINNAVGEVNAVVNDYVGELIVLLADHLAVFSDKINTISGDVLYAYGLNDLLANIDAFVESIFAAIADTVAQLGAKIAVA